MLNQCLLWWFKLLFAPKSQYETQNHRNELSRRISREGEKATERAKAAFDHGCQMAIARFLDRMCLALRASGLWLRHAMLQNLIPSLPWIAPGWRARGHNSKFCYLATLRSIMVGGGAARRILLQVPRSIWIQEQHKAAYIQHHCRRFLGLGRLVFTSEMFTDDVLHLGSGCA